MFRSKKRPLKIIRKFYITAAALFTAVFLLSACSGGSALLSSTEEENTEETENEIAAVLSDHGRNGNFEGGAAGGEGDESAPEASAYADDTQIVPGGPEGAEPEGIEFTGPGAESDKPLKTEQNPVEVGIGPGEAAAAAAEAVIEEITDKTVQNTSAAAAETAVSFQEPVPSVQESGQTAASVDTSIVEESPEKPSEVITWSSCRIEGDNISLQGALSGGITPVNTKMGEDKHLYLLELKPYENSVAGHRMTAQSIKATDVSFTVPLNFGTSDNRLYSKFLACIWDGTQYIPVSEPISVMNPEAAAVHQTAYKEPLSKKGLLIELPQISDAFALGVTNVIINIPFNTLVGQGIDYTYDGEVYHFSSDVVSTYDHTISMFSNKSMNVTAVLLNRYNPDTPDFFLPDTKKIKGVEYYQFNTSTEQGFKEICAVASFLADRYSGESSSYGRIQNWVIGNEINNQSWNYTGPMSLENYLTEYERSFRVFYNAIKSTCANDRVFFSLDNNWNQLANGTTRYGAKKTLETLAALIRKHGDLNWGLAYHPYSVPMTEPEFWNDFDTGQVSWSEDSKVVNFANLSVLTDFMQKSAMLNQNGDVRHIILSEQGFTSESATRGTVEKLQAAAFAYAYYIADSNPYIDAFILSRQIDAPSELKSSLAFGLWTTSSSEDMNILPDRKKYIWEVFQNIDRKKTTLENTEFAKELLGISKWSDVIPNFRWKRLENEE